MATVRASRADAQVADAPFVFTGRVVEPEGSTIAALKGHANIGIVKVDTVFRAPASLGPLTGRLLTMQFARGKQPKAGTRALFYAASWLFAESIAVIERGRTAPPKDEKSMLATVAAAELRLHDEALMERLRSAVCVVTGTVAQTEDTVVGEVRGFRSEHDPLWWQAEITVDQVEKGKLREPYLIVYFPSSLDEFWLDVPKLYPGQRGTFLLHHATLGKAARFEPPGPAIVHALDVQPSAHTERVRTLLKVISSRE
ncbi:hypothetical protein SB861_40275 [Paraburkholderia sp. SIMBA_049]